MPKREKDYNGLRWLEWLFPITEEEEIENDKKRSEYPTEEEWERIKANRLRASMTER